MEAAIRWSTSSDPGRKRFLIADVAHNRLEYGQITNITKNVFKYETISEREKLPNFTAFDWSKSDENLVAMGSPSGEAKVISMLAQISTNDFVRIYAPKIERKCNSIAFSNQNLLATGLDRARTDSSLNIYDLKSPSRSSPVRQLSGTEVVSNIKFFVSEPDLVLAGISRQCIRIYDLRDSSNVGAAIFSTRNVHFLSIDPMDENYFVSAGPIGENAVNVWDRRATARSTVASMSDSQSSGSILEVKPTIDTSIPADIWSLRYSGFRRGSFGVLSSIGQIRFFELNQPADPAGTRDLTANNLNDSSSVWYMKRTHDLQQAWKTTERETSEQRPIAFDFLHPNIFAPGESILTLRQNRELQMVKIPSIPPLVNFTALNELDTSGRPNSNISAPVTEQKICEDLKAVQSRAGKRELPESDGSPTDPLQSTVIYDALDHRSPVDREMAKFSSRERHEELQFLTFPRVKLSIEDALTVSNTQKRRCEEGYLFNCDDNKKIVHNDPWLVDLWETIKRLDDLARHDGMVSEMIDLSYLGVHDLWFMKIVQNPHRILRRYPNITPDVKAAIKWIRGSRSYPAFDGVQSQYPDHRQLCLAACGWRFSEKRLRDKCNEIITRGEYYKAIAVAVCHGRKDIALDYLKTLTREKKLENIGLAAVIACETINKDQRQLCAWMSEESDDPYLTMLLRFFVTGDWNSVVTMKELPLVYRVAVALKFLDDDRLSDFIDAATKESISQGDVEGIILTGLGEQSMDLFQNYIARFNDLQTAVLATAFTNPLYVDDMRWEMWKDTYFMEMQTWRAFIQRTRFTIQHNHKAVAPNGKRLIQPPPRQVTLRCSHCHTALARHDVSPDLSDDDASTVSGVVPAKGSLAAAGTVCPKCDRPMPRCGICMMWLGTPDPSKPGGVASLAKGDPMAKFVTFCMSCNHGCHAHHAREWFNKHQMCPVPDCLCACGAKH